MPKACLTKDEIRTLVNLIRQVFTFLQQLKSKEALAAKIQYPKIPSILSESIVIHLIKDGKILNSLAKVNDVYFGGREADVIVKSNSGKVKVEVKATGESGFEYFGPKDISADYIVWVHFGNFFNETANDSITVFIVEKPSNYFKEPVKITLDKLGKAASVEKLHLSLDEI